MDVYNIKHEATIDAEYMTLKIGERNTFRIRLEHPFPAVRCRGNKTLTYDSVDDVPEPYHSIIKKFIEIKKGKSEVIEIDLNDVGKPIKLKIKKQT